MHIYLKQKKGIDICAKGNLIIMFDWMCTLSAKCACIRSSSELLTFVQKNGCYLWCVVLHLCVLNAHLVEAVERYWHLCKGVVGKYDSAD